MDDTTALSYWLNWRFFLCASWVLIVIITSGVLIIKYEVVNKKRGGQQDDEPIGILYGDETWKTSLTIIHTGWLLAYRLIAFGVLLALIISNLVIGGARVLFFYTQWTFVLVTFYFGLASSLSIHGCYKYWNEVVDDDINNVDLDSPLIDECVDPQHMKPGNHGEIHTRKTAGVWGYLCQIVFQICAGAVGLTDGVFWFIIYPFLTPETYKLNFLNVSLHSINVVFLLIDVFLNRLRSPVFRLAYFGLWTCMFVIFQWILHACVSMRWPYSFLDLSSPYAPIWYFGLGLIHLPAFGIFSLLINSKQLLLLRSR